jgi:YVTN family beta-propeller protein
MAKRSAGSVAIRVLAFFLMSCAARTIFLLPCVVADDRYVDVDNQDRSPVDLAITPDGDWLVTANQTSGTLSLVRLADGAVMAETPCGQRPSAVAVSPDGKRVLASATYSGELHAYRLTNASIEHTGALKLGFEPRGIALSPDGRLAYVALTAANEVAVVELETLDVVARIGVGRWPRYLAISPDGKRLAVGTSGDGSISVVDTESRSKLFDSKFLGLNIGHVQVSSDGRYAYFPWMVYADRPITAGNIREGWVLGNRMARVRIDEQARREAIALDPRGKAVADPHGLALSPAEDWLAMSASGTHELVLLRLAELPLMPDGPGDHMDPDLAKDEERFVRIPLGGRPMGIRFGRDGQRVYVANYLDNSVQVVNVAQWRVERAIPLGGPDEPSPARRGEAIFVDALRSADGWYSCHSCHYEGGTNAITMDTKNDGSFGTYKMVLSLRNAPHTGPWFWHGWQNDLSAAVEKSLGDTMQGPAPATDDVRAVMAYLQTLESPPNSRGTSTPGELSAAAQRGQELFASDAAGCSNCHSGPYFTDGRQHDVGLGSSYDAYEGFNTPSLVDVANRAGYLHHGRAKSLAELLTDLHSPAKVSGTRELTPDEVADLVAYLETL